MTYCYPHRYPAGAVLLTACERAGVRPFSPHSFRRYVLTQIAEKVGDEAARRLAGHTDAKTTAGYISTTRKMLADAADALEAVG